MCQQMALHFYNGCVIFLFKLGNNIFRKKVIYRIIKPKFSRFNQLQDCHAYKCLLVMLPILNFISAVIAVPFAKSDTPVVPVQLRPSPFINIITIPGISFAAAVSFRIF